MSKPLAASITTTIDSLETGELDWFVWQAICDWPVHSGIDVSCEGLDYGALTRCFLWDKVPRAVRYRRSPAAFAFEQNLLNQHRQTSSSGNAYPNWKRRLKWPFQMAEQVADGVRFRVRQAADSGSVIFVPRQHLHVRSTLRSLAKDSSLRLVAPLEHGINPGVTLFQTPSVKKPNTAFAKQLYQGIVRGLKAFEIELLLGDQQRLQQQIEQQMTLIRQVEAELAAANPQALLVFADTHTPLQEYVAVANRQGIPTVLLQHGLDCEQFCLNDVQSAVVAVWGSARKKRYEAESQRRPVRIEVTGNPEYDQLRLPTQLCAGGDRWLWATRPHGPHKCLSPSRSPHEGLDILAALLAALKQHKPAQLMIKPHPLDYIDLYATQIEQHGLGDRVTINRDPLLSVLPQADIVISEDSTAALEAMCFGKIVVHAHFAASPPVLPLADYAAALPAYSSESLALALGRARSLTLAEQETMLAGQHRFVNDYGGALDSCACSNVTALILEVVAGNNN